MKAWQWVIVALILWPVIVVADWSRQIRRRVR